MESLKNESVGLGTVWTENKYVGVDQLEHTVNY